MAMLPGAGTGMFSKATNALYDRTALWRAIRPITRQAVIEALEQRQLLTAVPILHYQFEDGSGTNVDDSAGTFDATLTNGASFGSSGRNGGGGAGVFDGTNDHATAEDDPALRFGSTDSFSISVWAKPTALTNSWAGVVTKSRDSSPWYGIWISDANRWVAGGSPNITGPTATTDWTHVAVVQDGSANTRKLYVNGVFESSGSAQAATGTGDLIIGGVTFSLPEYFTGLIDDVRIYDVALTGAEIEGLATLPPLPATNLSAVGTVGQIQLHWTASSGALSYNVYRSTSSGDTGATPYQTGLSSPTFTDIAADAGTTYYYQITSVSAAGESDKSAQASALTAPAAPTLSVLVEADQVQLDWVHSTASAASVVERSTDGRSWEQIAAVAYEDPATYTDSAIIPTTQYHYRVRGANASGVSPWALPTSVLTASHASAPEAPSGLAAVAASTEIQLSWDDVSDETGYSIWLSSGGSFTQIDTVLAGVTTYTIEDLTPLTRYGVRVLAYNASGSSGSSADNQITVSTEDTPFNAPTGVTFDDVGPTSMKILWTDTNAGTTKFEIERKTGNGNFSKIAQVDAGVTEYVVGSLWDETEYTFRVRAIKPGFSAYSAPASETTLAHPISAIDISAVPDGSDLDITASDTTQTSNAEITVLFQVRSSDHFDPERWGTEDIGLFDEPAVDHTATYVATEWFNSWFPHLTVRGKPGSWVTDGMSIVSGTTGYTNYVTVERVADLNAPTLLGGTRNSNGTITLNWTDNSSDEDGFLVWDLRSPSMMFVDPIAWASENATTVTFDPVPPFGPEGEGVFVVHAKASGGLYSVYSNYVDLRLPAAPAEATAVVSGGKHRLAWTNSAFNETGYEIQGSLDGGKTWTLLGTTEADDASYVVDTPGPALYYQYRVRAVNAAGTSEYVQADTIARPTVPDCGCGSPLVAPRGSGDANSGTPGVSEAGVGYFDGSARGSGGIGSAPSIGSWAWQTELASTLPTYGPSSGGYSDAASIFPTLAVVPDTRWLVARGGGLDAWWIYDDEVGDFSLPLLNQASISGTSSSSTLTLADGAGNELVFNNFATSASHQGLFAQHTDSLGVVTQVTAWTTEGDIEVVERTVTVAGDTVTERLTLAYDYELLTERPVITDITIERKVNAGSWATVQEIEYSHYGDEPGEHGMPGNVKSVLVTEPGGETQQTYYRYYKTGDTDGPAGWLKSAVSSRSYDRMISTLGTLDSASDQAIAPFAEARYVYDALGRVAAAVVPGRGRYTYSYASSENPIAFNHWAYKTIETTPDGTVNTVYSNAYGGVILSLTSKGADKTASYYRYDDLGRVELATSGAAIAGFDEAQWDLVNHVDGGLQYLWDGAGEITRYTYYATTDADHDTAGGVEGYLESVWRQTGDQGSQIELSRTGYFLVAGQAVVASSITFEDESGLVELEDAYEYTFHSGSAVPASMTLTRPVVSTSHNGSGTAESETTIHDTLGRAIWHKDAAGFLSYTAYDPATGAVIRQITDVDVSKTGDFDDLPSGWTTPAGGGAHLVTLKEVDAKGRTIKYTGPGGEVTYTVYLDGDHEVRTYQWDPIEDERIGPTQVSRSDVDGGYSETLTMTATPALDGSGRPDGTEAISGLKSLSRTYSDSTGRVTHSDSYFDLGGFIYTAAASLGVEGTDFLRTRYGYDEFGRQVRVEAPDGTITRTVLDDMGRTLGTWVGLDDTPTAGTWSPSNTAGASMFLVSSAVHDDDGRILTSTSHGDDQTTYVTEYRYDDRDRLVATRGADQLVTAYTLDNLGRAAVVEVYFDADLDFVLDSGELRAKSESLFDEQGQTYRSFTYEVDPTTGDIGDRLTTNVWYDPRGMTIKVMDSNGLFSKSAYDGAGRLVSSYMSFDGDEETYAEALTVAGDTVIEQSDTLYWLDKAVASIAYQRLDGDTTSTGALTAGNSYATSTVMWYDPAGRTTHTAFFGHETGSTRYVFNTSEALIDTDTDGVPDIAQGSPLEPDTSDLYIASRFEYDPAGLQHQTTDNAGRVTIRHFDPLGRTIRLIENYVDGVVTETENATDRVTRYLYDSAGRLSVQRAHNPKGTGNGVEQQDTLYLYNSQYSGAFNTSIIYPDSADTDDTGSDQVKFAHDRLGRVVSKTDQRGVVHEYGYDSAGRLAADAVTSLGASNLVDGTIRRIGWTYDDMGRIKTVTSYDAATAGNVVNQVEREYDGWGNLSAEKQEHAGAVDGNTPGVEYIYEDGAASGEAKYIRLLKMVYPDGREVFHNYEASGVGGVLSRLESLSDDAMGTEVLESYRYLGTGTIIGVSRPGINGGLNLSYGSAGTYGGWDRFGRVILHEWRRDDTTLVDGYAYTYDRAGSRTAKFNLMNSDYDEIYDYDALNRLISTERDGDPYQSWDLDALGNWTGFDNQGTPETRDHNAANEIDAAEYDAAGNMVEDLSGQQFTYDAWNRVAVAEYTKAEYPSMPWTLSYAYDGLNRRIGQLAHDAIPELRPEYSKDWYYSAHWQVLEEHEAGSAMRSQHVWSPIYVDAMIARDRGGPGSLDTSFAIGGRVEAEGTYAGLLMLDDDSVILAAASPGEFKLLGFDADGAPLSGFGTAGVVTTDVGTSEIIRVLAVQSNGKILAGGSANGDFALVRYNSDGSLDSGFGSGGVVTTNMGGVDHIMALRVESDGTIIAAGLGGAGFAVAHYQSDGTLDTNFDGDGIASTAFAGDSIAAVQFQSDGKMVISGPQGGVSYMQRFDVDATLDSTFGSSGFVDITSVIGPPVALLVDENDDLIQVTSDWSSTNVVKFDADGDELDHAAVNFWNIDSGPYVSGAFLSGTKILLAGSVTGKAVVIRLSSDLTMDSTFGREGVAFATGTSGDQVAVQSDGKILLATGYDLNRGARFAPGK